MIFVRDIMAATASDYGLPVEAMWERGAKRDRSKPRQLAMYLTQCLTRHSTVRIGQLFHRDHSTVIHGARAARKRVVADAATSAAARRITRVVLNDCFEFVAPSVSTSAAPRATGGAAIL